MSRAGRRAPRAPGPAGLWPAGCALVFIVVMVVLAVAGVCALALALVFVHVLHPTWHL